MLTTLTGGRIRPPPPYPDTLGAERGQVWGASAEGVGLPNMDSGASEGGELGGELGAVVDEDATPVASPRGGGEVQGMGVW